MATSCKFETTYLHQEGALRRCGRRGIVFEVARRRENILEADSINSENGRQITEASGDRVSMKVLSRRVSSLNPSPIKKNFLYSSMQSQSQSCLSDPWNANFYLLNWVGKGRHIHTYVKM